MALSIEQMREMVAAVDYKTGYLIQLKRDDPTNPSDRWYLQVKFLRKDVITNQMGYGYSGKRYVSVHMCPGEFVRAIFGTLAALEEHECRENFTYKGRRIFGPHISLDALMEAAGHIEVRDT